MKQKINKYILFRVKFLRTFAISIVAEQVKKQDRHLKKKFKQKKNLILVNSMATSDKPDIYITR